ncbi:aldehyde dehydrogenase family protein [Leucobacter rhizosphaerae]|uniref:Aldehyde dehydrogenase family protein n=1 Tax=Leucobacter rhizosphaerae TaxID=2932245 RepID=A0ABY4FTK9_9MICO|nr:aldehyde dehydrogenase family protein [Leucobacter rhizosphaerae]UOQ59581.1 aldehyde dehydrogenase family protein [Leucobacter rhizosphaerae]
MRALPADLDLSLASRIADDGAQLFIDGELQPAHSGRTFEAIDPFTDEPWHRVADADETDVDRAVEAARRAQVTWAATSAYDRSRVLLDIADAVESRAQAFGILDTLDNGKLLRETSAQAAGVAHSLRFSAGNAEKIEGVTAPASKPDLLAMTVREPIGVIGMIVPWNSPVPLLISAAAPALAAGNAVVVKSSEDATASILAFAELAHASGLPAGLLNVVSGRGSAAGNALVRHPAVQKIVFTGGDEVGRRVAVSAAELLKPVMLELGGKSPQIVFADADLDRAVNGLVGGVFAAMGQTCVAGGRALVHVDVHDELVERLAARAATLRFGDPLDPATEIGPLGSARQLERARGFVEHAHADGARLAAGGGTRPTGAGGGSFFEPAVFADVAPEHRLYREEVFGPVIGFTPFSDFEHAMELANATRFGLAAGVWTQDIDTALRAARRIESGTVWVNTYRAPEASLSAGGVKDSGYGRLGGRRELEEFTREKTVIINYSGIGNDPFVMGGSARPSDS